MKTAVNRDLEYPGGVAGSIYDRYYVVDASTNKQHQIFRAALTLAIFSRIGTANISNGKEATAFIAYLQQATDDINRAAGDVYISPAPAAGAPDTCAAAAIDSSSGCMPVLFESDLPAVERSLASVAIAGLPRQQAAQFVQAIKQENVGGSLRAALKLAFASLDSLHRGAAVHRSNVELFAVALAAGSADCKTNPNGPDCGDQIATIAQALCFMGIDPAGGLDCTGTTLSPPKKGAADYKAQLLAYRTQLAAIPIDRKFFAPAFVMIQTSCIALPLDTESQNDNETIKALKDARSDTCAKLVFAPIARKLLPATAPDETVDSSSDAAADNGQQAAP